MSSLSRNPLRVLLTGFTVATGAVAGIDSILSAIQKLWGNANLSTTLALTSGATTIDASAGSGRTYRLTTTTTAAITININNLPIGDDYWECQLLMRTTAVPASVEWAGATVNYMPSLSFSEYPMAAGRLTRVILSRQLDGAATRVTAMVWPANVTS